MERVQRGRTPFSGHRARPCVTGGSLDPDPAARLRWFSDAEGGGAGLHRGGDSGAGLGPPPQPQSRAPRLQWRADAAGSSRRAALGVHAPPPPPRPSPADPGEGGPPAAPTPACPHFSPAAPPPAPRRARSKPALHRPSRGAVQRGHLSLGSRGEGRRLDVPPLRRVRFDRRAESPRRPARRTPRPPVAPE